MPAKTSPVPAEASSGPPISLTKVLSVPLKNTTVLCPFKITADTPYFSAIFFAEFSLSP